MTELQRLLNVSDPAWPQVQEWIRAATVPVEILPPDPASREASLLEVGVTVGSALGAVVYETGGLLIDHGWLRLRGSGHGRLPRRVVQDRSWVVIAEDVVGGFFALYPPEGEVMYLAPDTLKWESMQSKYSAWLRWMMSGSLAKFYEPYRGPGWEKLAGALRPDQSYMIVPPPWTEGAPYPQRTWMPTPIDQLYGMTLSIQEQLGLSGPPGV